MQIAKELIMLPVLELTQWLTGGDWSHTDHTSADSQGANHAPSVGTNPVAHWWGLISHWPHISRSLPPWATLVKVILELPWCLSPLAARTWYNALYCHCHRYYSASIIKMAGISDEHLAIWLAAVTATINFFFTIVGVWLVERLGRKRLLLGSLTGEVAMYVKCWECCCSSLNYIIAGNCFSVTCSNN